MSLYDELKTLSAHLSPSIRVGGSEVADVLSALVAYLEHGPSIIDAAHDGPQAVYDLLHDHQVKVAADDGLGPPVKGQPLQHQPAPGRFGPPPAVSRSDFEKLTALVQRLVDQPATTQAPVDLVQPAPVDLVQQLVDQPAPAPAPVEHEPAGPESD